MKEVTAKLIVRIKRTPTVESFRFVPATPFDFLPGQFLQLVFDRERADNKELNKYLSLSCAPGLPYVEVTKRLSQSQFSGRLKELKVDDEVLLKGPMGNCVFREEYTHIGFLIGGIGITPVVSILEHVARLRLPADAVLVYSNRVEEEIAFKKELDLWKTLNTGIQIFYLVSDCEPKDKSCAFGVIDKELLQARVCDLHKRMFFIFGPPKMVEAMKQLAVDMQCSPDNIKTETFVGY